MKTFGLKTIGTFILIISIMYPINIMFNEGYTLKMVYSAEWETLHYLVKLVL